MAIVQAASPTGNSQEIHPHGGPSIGMQRDGISAPSSQHGDSATVRNPQRW